MKFLCDMGVSPKTANWLTSNGYDCVHLRDRNLQRLPDSDIIALAEEEGRVILTMDLDFSRLMSQRNTTMPSVITFRLNDERAINVQRVLAIALSKFEEALESGAMITLTERNARVRHLPL